jgi:hypothetical protein
MLSCFTLKYKFHSLVPPSALPYVRYIS